jgi:hypothetical protein
MDLMISEAREVYEVPLSENAVDVESESTPTEAVSTDKVNPTEGAHCSIQTTPLVPPVVVTAIVPLSAPEEVFHQAATDSPPPVTTPSAVKPAEIAAAEASAVPYPVAANSRIIFPCTRLAG